VIKGVKAPIISEGFVGMCCKSMQKLCHDIKLSWIERHRSRTKQDMVTMYDGKVQAEYARFPNNAQTCLRLADPLWNPPVWVVKRWVEINMEKWRGNHVPGKVIFLSPLNLMSEEQALDKLFRYIELAKREVKQIFDLTEKQEQQEKVDTIVIPVRWAGAWSMYCTMRKTHV
jgi:hypothetical protein